MENTKENEITNYDPKDLDLLESVTDWYITKDLNKSFIYPNATSVLSSQILKDFIIVLANDLSKAIKKKVTQTENEDFAELFIKTNFNNNSYYFRGNKIKGIEGDIWALRLIRNKTPNLLDLGMPRSLIDVLTNDKLKNGLILIVGETGNGKSTTCGGIINEFCSNRGSFALTIEDPPELPLHGRLGKGMCIQTEVGKNGFSEAIRSAMRSYPTANNSILYVGEIRDKETAKELIKVAANGHLVFTTIHGSDITSGIRRLIDIATDGDSGKISDVKTMLASSLRLVVHQELKSSDFILDKKNADSVKKEKFLKINFVLSGGARSQVANSIISDSLDANIPTIIDKQRITLQNSGVKGLLKEEFGE